MKTYLSAKIHRAHVTESDLNYIGSLTIDCALMELAGIEPYEKVLVSNFTNGARFETYAIAGPRGSGTISLNGGSARQGLVGDILTIFTFATLEQWEPPTVVFVDEHNRATDVLRDEGYGKQLPISEETE
jgi:aspartate 1-decarboxylase